MSAGLVSLLHDAALAHKQLLRHTCRKLPALTALKVWRNFASAQPKCGTTLHARDVCPPAHAHLIAMVLRVIVIMCVGLGRLSLHSVGESG